MDDKINPVIPMHYDAMIGRYWTVNDDQVMLVCHNVKMPNVMITFYISNEESL